MTFHPCPEPLDLWAGAAGRPSMVSYPGARRIFADPVLAGQDARPVALDQALEEIFFEAAARKAFHTLEDRSAFKDRWLGRYLEKLPDLVSIAVLTGSGNGGPKVAGYVVGSAANAATDEEFSDISYFQTFAAECAAFPAHLHINLAPGFRGQGLGARLVARFAAAAYVRGAGGLHVVTGLSSRNRSFYARLGLQQIATATFSGADVVMLATRLPLKAPR